ncbi:uncharacterized protein LOC110862835 [Folsomia candida]|uniref:uncharacterized protein LOC110862835 n=1 Tax=Folsomia candida TaxID=158441 RepID=UPI000B8F93C3|nr:uncharacterized protein LOC110862835 [Folsomia candida]
MAKILVLLLITIIAAKGVPLDDNEDQEIKQDEVRTRPQEETPSPEELQFLADLQAENGKKYSDLSDGEKYRYWKNHIDRVVHWYNKIHGFLKNQYDNLRS